MKPFRKYILPDPSTWEEFRTILHSRGMTVSGWFRFQVAKFIKEEKS